MFGAARETSESLLEIRSFISPVFLVFFYLVRELHICENNLHEFIYGDDRLLYYQVKLDT